MKKYFDLNYFIAFLGLLENNKDTKLFTESAEDGSISSYNFMKLQFAGETIILYESYCGGTGIIQDSPVAPWEDYAEGVFEDLVRDGDYKVFIEA